MEVLLFEEAIVAFVPGSQGLAIECFAELEDSAVRFSNTSIQTGRLACILNRLQQCR